MTEDRTAVAAPDAASRTEALFRQAGALREGHFRLKSGRHSDRYLEKFQVLQYPAITSELCAMLAAFGRPSHGADRQVGAGGTTDARSAQEALAVAMQRAWPVRRRVTIDPALVAKTLLAALPEGWRLGPSGTSESAALVDVVAGPTTGGVILAFETARQLGVRSVFAEEVRDAQGSRREFRRGFTISPGERVLLVDDILTTGGSLAAMLPAAEAFGADIVAIAVLVDRSGGQTSVTSPKSGRTYPIEALWRLDLQTWEPGEDCPGCRADVPLEEPGSGGAAAA